MTRVLVLSGGRGSERQISLRSGANIAEALTQAGYDVISADPQDESLDLEQVAKVVDVVIPMLHGVGGEDGEIQARLEALNVKYLGSDSRASKLAFDKVATKDLMTKNDIKTPVWEVVDRQSFTSSKLLNNPYVLKPIQNGSAVDTFIVRHVDSQTIGREVLDNLFERYDHMLLEELIIGDEITVGVIDTTPTPVIKIIPPDNEEFDYENKYNGRSKEIVDPVDVPDDIKSRSQQIALQLHHLVGARHISRTDMLMYGNDIYTLEINTLPGMTDQSLIPKMALGMGIDIKKLVKKFVFMAQRDN